MSTDTAHTTTDTLSSTVEPSPIPDPKTNDGTTNGKTPKATEPDGEPVQPVPTTNGTSTPSTTTTTTTTPTIPPYALTYAPLLYLHKREPNWPATLQNQLINSVPVRSDGTDKELPPLDAQTEGTMQELKVGWVNDPNTYLTCKEDPRINRNQPWLIARYGKPDPETHRSEAPVFIIVVDKSDIVGPGTVDVFYFYFYAFNLGPRVLGVHYGNHSSDWEHNMIRFKDGVPQAIHYSQHADGFAYTYAAVQKGPDGKRPITYPAIGSHANYPTLGCHQYTGIPFGPVDYTTKGPLWDPTLNYLAFTYTPTPSRDQFFPIPPPVVSAAQAQSQLQPASSIPPTILDPTPFLPAMKFQGVWGDQDSYPKKPQPSGPNKVKNFFDGIGVDLYNLGQSWKGLIWGEGATGPRDKSLDRKGMNRTSDTVANKI